MKLYKEFISDEQNKEKLEILINNNGMEHLIDVITLNQMKELSN